MQDPLWLAPRLPGLLWGPPSLLYRGPCLLGGPTLRLALELLGLASWATLELGLALELTRRRRLALELLCLALELLRRWGLALELLRLALHLLGLALELLGLALELLGLALELLGWRGLALELLWRWGLALVLLGVYSRGVPVLTLHMGGQQEQQQGDHGDASHSPLKQILIYKKIQISLDTLQRMVLLKFC